MIESTKGFEHRSHVRIVCAVLIVLACLGILFLEIKHLPYRGQNSLYLDGVHQPWPKAFAGYSFVAKLACF